MSMEANLDGKYFDSRENIAACYALGCRVGRGHASS